VNLAHRIYGREHRPIDVKRKLKELIKLADQKLLVETLSIGMALKRLEEGM